MILFLHERTPFVARAAAEVQRNFSWLRAATEERNPIARPGV